MPNHKKTTVEPQNDGDTLIGAEKKRGRKCKKQNTTEILHAYQIEQEQLEEDREVTTVEERGNGSKGTQGYTKKNYENFAYLSPK